MKSPAHILSAVLVLMAVLCLPVTAMDTITALHNVEIRQAHLAWTSLDKDIEMNAAVTYCGTLYGADTTGMSALLARFRKEEALIPSEATGKDVDVLIADMQNTTLQFREETSAVMTTGQGKWDILNLQISAAKDNNPYLLEKKNVFWAVQKANHLADFDAWVKDGQQKLDTLEARGYDITTAQRALDVFSSKRPDVLAALESKTENAVQSINPETLSLSEEFARKLALVQEQVPDSIRFRFFIDQGERVVGLADQVNYALVPILIDIGELDPVLVKTKTDLTTARTVLGSGNLGAAKAPLRLVQEDFTDLAQAYRSVARTVVLPDELSAELNTLAFRLDKTAEQMRGAL